MSAPPTQPTLRDNLPPGAPDPHGHREALDELVAIGTDFARLLHRQATAHAGQPAPAPQPTGTPQAADAPPAPPPSATAPNTLVSLAAAFGQVARAVRRCVMLAQALDAPKPSAPDPARERAAARRQIIRKVEDVIQRPSCDRDPDGPGADALRAELRERLDAPDLDDDIATRPVADVIRDITRDLGLDRMPGTRPFRRRTPADVALLCAQAAAPSRPCPPGPVPQTPPPHDAAPRPQATAPQGAERQGPEPGALQPSPDPPGQHSGEPSPATRTQPGPVHPGSTLPNDPAEAVAFVLRHAARADARWRTPRPSG